MKRKNKILTVIASLSLCVAMSLGVVACASTGNGNSGGKTENPVTAKEVYAVSAFSGANYLISEGTSGETAYAGVSGGAGIFFAPYTYTDKTPEEIVSQKETATERPSDYTDESVNGIKNCLKMFDSLLLGGGIQQTVENNTADGELGQYAFVMTVKANEKEAKMYYNEVSSTTETETDEDGEEETEIKTVLKGVLLFGGETFEVDGKKELETEGDETEYSVEFITKKDDGNYVKFSYETEQERNESELSYKCVIYKNHKKVTEVKLEFEEENGKTDIKFKLKNNGSDDGTEYKITKKEGSDKFDIRHEFNGKKSYVSAEKTADGYIFLYSNGFSENVGF